jgi:hypothetical protein
MIILNTTDGVNAIFMHPNVENERMTGTDFNQCSGKGREW